MSHTRRRGRPSLGSDVPGRGVVLLALLVELWQALRLGRASGLLERSNGGADAVEPLLLVEHIIGLQSVGLAWRGVLEANPKDIFS